MPTDADAQPARPPSRLYGDVLFRLMDGERWSKNGAAQFLANARLRAAQAVFCAEPAPLP
jgi:hypothetical protein